MGVLGGSRGACVAWRVWPGVRVWGVGNPRGDFCAPSFGFPPPTRVWLRRRPTLPHPPRCSTIGAVGLSFRVRNETGRFPNAMTTASSSSHPPNTTGTNPKALECGLRVIRIVVASTRLTIPHKGGRVLFSVGPLVPVGSRAHYCASTSGLSTQSSTGGLHTPQVGCRKPHLGAGFPLRCFQRLSLPNVANQPCTWRYNWHTRGSSIPVLSY